MTEIVHFPNPSVKADTLPGKGGIYYWTLDPIIWFGLDGKQREVPAHFLSDGYSVPECMWSLIRGLTSIVPAVVHDERYAAQDCTRAEADYLLRVGIIETGGSRYTAWKVWLGVRAGGWIAWNRYARMKKKYGDESTIQMHMAETEEDALLKAKYGLEMAA